MKPSNKVTALEGFIETDELTPDQASSILLAKMLEDFEQAVKHRRLEWIEESLRQYREEYKPRTLPIIKDKKND